MYWSYKAVINISHGMIVIAYNPFPTSWFYKETHWHTHTKREPHERFPPMFYIYGRSVWNTPSTSIHSSYKCTLESGAFLSLFLFLLLSWIRIFFYGRHFRLNSNINKPKATRRNENEEINKIKQLQRHPAIKQRWTKRNKTKSNSFGFSSKGFGLFECISIYVPCLCEFLLFTPILALY